MHSVAIDGKPVSTVIPGSGRAQYGFTTMGCPAISFAELGALTRRYQMDFVELRALEGSLDLPDYFARKTAAMRAPQPEVRLIATSLILTEASAGDVEKFLRFVDLAIVLGAPYVRVFGGGKSGVAPSASQLELAVHTVERCRAGLRARGDFCEMLIETHSAFSSPDHCLELNRCLDRPLSILWDSHHTWREGGELPRETWNKIGPLVRHIHFSDSRIFSPERGREWVLPGQGEYPVRSLVELLAEVKYDRGVSLEWEKIWHPELPEIPAALDAFVHLFGLAGKS